MKKANEIENYFLKNITKENVKNFEYLFNEINKLPEKITWFDGFLYLEINENNLEEYKNFLNNINGKNNLINNFYIDKSNKLLINFNEEYHKYFLENFKAMKRIN